jgi:hypothetical protein
MLPVSAICGAGICAAHGIAIKRIAASLIADFIQSPSMSMQLRFAGYGALM